MNCDRPFRLFRRLINGYLRLVEQSRACTVCLEGDVRELETLETILQYGVYVGAAVIETADSDR